MGLQGVEMILLGYNRPVHHPSAPDHDLLANFRSSLVMCAGAHQNGTWVVAVAEGGREEGVSRRPVRSWRWPPRSATSWSSRAAIWIHYRLILERAGAIPPA
jgi:hypothetical protein